MTTGFTPIQVQAAETPSTDEVLRAVKDAAHMLRRAAASSPSRPHQVQLHHRASERESLARQMQDIKAGGQRVFGEDCDSPVIIAELRGKLLWLIWNSPACLSPRITGQSRSSRS